MLSYDSSIQVQNGFTTVASALAVAAAAAIDEARAVEVPGAAKLYAIEGVGWLRIRAEETEFDPDYFLNVSELTGGRIGCCSASGGGSTAYIQVLYEERTGITDRTEFFGAAHNDWRLWRVDLASQRAEEVTSLPWFGTSGVTVFEMLEGVLVPILTFGGESGGLFSSVERWTTLVNLTSGPEPTPTVTVDGNLLFFERIRREGSAS